MEKEKGKGKRDKKKKVQRDVNANMRGVLVDWLVEVAEEYKLVSDTLYFCVAYIDRFLSLIHNSRPCHVDVHPMP